MIIFNLQLLFVRVSGAETLFFSPLSFYGNGIIFLSLHSWHTWFVLIKKKKNCSHENQFSSISQIKGVVRWESHNNKRMFSPYSSMFGFSIISMWKVSLFPKWSGRAKISGQFNQKENGNIGSQTVWNHCIFTYRKIEKKHGLSNGAVHKCVGLLIVEIWWWIVVHFLYLPNRTWPLVIKFRHRHIPDIMNFPHGTAETSYSWEPDWG